jgi:hypothetical protein
MLPSPLPAPACPISVRVATLADLPFIDSLQKLHTKQVGWMPTKQLEGKIKAGHVIIAEERHEGTEARRHEGVIEGAGISAESALDSSLPGPHSVPPCLGASVPIGYAIGHDQYFKRDDVGIIYQLNVLPTKRRALVGATLIKAMFERAAYGCRLFCCWCAQDIEANHFWESLGFVPLAFRTGSRGKERVHIFWQRRIRAGDETTPYWFPSQTGSGSIREDRLVFPIPPGTHWSDAKPIVLPGMMKSEEPKQLPAPKLRKSKAASVMNPSSISAGGLRFVTPKPEAAEEKPKRGPKPKVKHDPAHIAAARELRDRWLERVNADPSILTSSGKYDVARALESPPQRTTVKARPAPELPAPAIAA